MSTVRKGEIKISVFLFSGFYRVKIVRKLYHNYPEKIMKEKFQLMAVFESLVNVLNRAAELGRPLTDEEMEEFRIDFSKEEEE